MSDKKWSAEDILMELKVSEKKRNESVDVDALLKDILHEERYVEQSAPVEEDEEEEVSTKRFRRQKKAAAQTVDTAFQKSSIAQKIEATGKLFIDVDKIRAQQPKPRMIPADPIDDEEEEEKTPRKFAREIRFNQEKEDIDFEDKLEFAPSFANFAQYDSEDQASSWSNLLLSEQKKALVKSFLSFCLFGVSVLAVIILQMMRKDSVELSSTVPWVITAIGGIGGLLCYDILWKGIVSLIRFRPDRNILPAVCFLVTFLHSVAVSAVKDAFLEPNTQIYLPLGLLSLAVSCSGRHAHVSAAFHNLLLFQSEGEKYVPHIIGDSRMAGELTRGMIEQLPVMAVNQPVSGLRSFLRYSFSADRSDLLARNLSAMGLIAGAVCGLFAFLFSREWLFALTAAVLTVSVFAPAINGILTASPLRSLSTLLGRTGSMVTSEKAAAEYENVNAVLLDAQSLFPASMVVLSGIKTFAGMRIDEAIIDAASVLREAGSIFDGIFFKMIGGNTALLRKVEQLVYEDNLGVSAWVNRRRILIGNRALLESHGVAMPSIDYEKRFIAEGKELLYLASGGDLTAVFVVSIHASVQAEDTCQMLSDNGIGMAIRTIDPIVTAETLSRLFQVPEYYFKIVPQRLHESCKELSSPVMGRPALTVNNGTALSAASSLCASKRVKVFITILQLVQTISVLVNMITVAALVIFGSLSGISGFVAAAIQLGWLLIALLVQKLLRI